MIEVVVALIILSIALLGLAGASGVALQQTVRGNEEVELWAAMQRASDSLIALGRGNVSGGTRTIDGYELDWWVSGTDDEIVSVEYPRSSRSSGASLRDTLILYLPE